MTELAPLAGLSNSAVARRLAPEPEDAAATARREVEEGRRMPGTVPRAPVPAPRAPEAAPEPDRLTTRAARPILSRAPEASPELRQWMSLRRTHVGIRTNAQTATIPNQMTALIALPY
jgi:hypothetical protein